MSRAILRRAATGAALLLAAWLTLPALVDSAEDEGKLPADLSLVPRDGGGFVTVRLADLVGQKSYPVLLSAVTGQDLAGSVERSFRVAPASVERLTVVLHRGPGLPVFVVRTARPYDRAGLLKAFGGLPGRTVSGKKVYAAPGLTPLWNQMAWPVDDHTFVAGTELAMLSYLADLSRAGKGRHALADELKAAAGKHTLVAGLRPALLVRQTDAFRRALQEKMRKREDFKEKVVPDKPGPRDTRAGAGDSKDEVPKLRELEDVLRDLDRSALPFRPLLRADRALVTADLGAEARAAARLHYTDEAAAKDGVLGVQMALYALRELLPEAFRQTGLDPDGKVTAALVKPLQAALRAAAVSREGTAVEARLEVKLDTPALARFLAERALFVRDSNNLKQIGLAFHNYHDARGSMPAAAIVDKGGKPLLSWRVAILPYVDQDALYRQFRLDEPWDSPHNKKLLGKMPRIYAPVAGRAAEPDSTCYQVFTGPNTLYPSARQRGGPRLVGIPDGTANTLLVVEASEAVPWTKPQDLLVDPKKPLPKLGGQFDRVFHALFCDGRVELLRRDFDEKTMRLAVDPADGNVLDLRKLKP